MAIFIYFWHAAIYENTMPQEVKQATEKYSYAVFKFLNSLCKLYYMKEIFDFLAFVIVINSNRFNEFEIVETLLNPSSGQEAVCSECKRLEFLRSSKTAKEYLTGKNVADKSLLYTFEERFERAGKYEKTTMSAINVSFTHSLLLLSLIDHNLFIKRSEEKWTAREDLNEVEKKYFVQTRQNANKNQHVLEQKSKYAYHLVSTQIWTIKLKLLKEVKTINRYRESKNNLTDMIEEAEYQRFKFYKTLTSEDRIYRLVRAMDKEREICRILD
ncbi:hypothetical protein KSF78_0004584 [Schistosoma japonicum]|nr:hypothetical protein KSF78_0004584 [Schistosoma japonicum]